MVLKTLSLCALLELALNNGSSYILQYGPGVMKAIIEMD